MLIMYLISQDISYLLFPASCLFLSLTSTLQGQAYKPRYLLPAVFQELLIGFLIIHESDLLEQGPPDVGKNHHAQHVCNQVPGVHINNAVRFQFFCYSFQCHIRIQSNMLYYPHQAVRVQGDLLEYKSRQERIFFQHI